MDTAQLQKIFVYLDYAFGLINEILKKINAYFQQMIKPDISKALGNE